MIGVSSIHEDVERVPYVGSFRNIANNADPRLFRGGSCCSDDELERTDLATVKVEDDRRGPAVTPAFGLEEGFSTATEALAYDGFSLDAGDRSLACTWSLDVRDGADVKPVDCVSCE